jgi:putative transcriptional regulator
MLRVRKEIHMLTNSVAKWRMARGVSKAHLARRVGVDRSYITKLEQGKLQPSGDMMFRLARYLGQPLEQVFAYTQSACEKHDISGRYDA